MLRVTVIASGNVYQMAAASAASTFALFAHNPSSVSVLVPVGERISRSLRRQSLQFGFSIERFPFDGDLGEENFTGRLKCTAFAWKLEQLKAGEIALFADADTACLRKVRLPKAIKRQILLSQVGMVPDIKDRHCLDSAAAYYLASKNRCVYVNSGVIFASRKSLGFFETVRQLANNPEVLAGPFQDQNAINFAFGRYFPKTLLPLDKKFNAIQEFNKQTVIAHFAGGAGLLGQHVRKSKHLKTCSRVIMNVT